MNPKVELFRKDFRRFASLSNSAQTIKRASIAGVLGAIAMSFLPAAAMAQGGCSNGVSTQISGTVYAPNGTDPLPNILVYIPATTPNTFTDGVSPTNPVIDNAANLVSGNPIVQTTTAANGQFTLTNAPSGTNVPLVIQAGRWRRQFIISSVTQCQPNPITTLTQGGPSGLGGYGESTTIRFAQTQSEGDIPKMALATGKADALECTLRKVGVADTEFTDYTVDVLSGGTGPGRISLFEGAGSSGVKAGSTTHAEATLVGSTSSSFSGSLLGSYNILMLPCQGDSTDYTTSDGRSNVIAFTGAGGRIFATHHSAFYIDQDSPTDTAATWSSDKSVSDGEATINTSFASGALMAQWLQDINSTTTLAQVELDNDFNDQTGINSPTEIWATMNSNSDIMQFSFYTPVGASTANQYGRVMFNEYHVDNTTTSDSVTFPNECTGTMAKDQSMSSQEHMLEYSLFDLMNFAVPVTSTNVAISATPSPSNFTGGDQADTVTVQVTNNGSSAIGTSPTVNLTVTLPAGLTPVSMIDPLGNWNCNVNTLTCTLLNPLAASDSNSVVLTVSVAANVTAGNASIGATVGSIGFVASTTSNITLSVAAAPPGTVTGPLTTNAGATNVGTTATGATTVTFAISGGSTVSAVNVVTEGYTGKDFTNANSGTCVAKTYASPTTCTVTVNFTPAYPGLRIGAVQIFGPSNALLDTAYISGIGLGPEITFQPGTQTAIVTGPGSYSFNDSAVDIAGNTYLVDTLNNQVLKETLAGNTYNQTTAVSGLNGPTSIAIDGAGNLYIANTGAGQVLKETLVGSSYTQSIVANGLFSPDGVAVDATGNVYIADADNNRVLIETASGNIYTQSILVSGLSSPSRVAVDLNGNVYVADTANNRVVEEVYFNGGYTQTVVDTSLSSPIGVAVDDNGNVYIADTGDNRVVLDQASNGSFIHSQLVGGLNHPVAVTLDQLGNLYITDRTDDELFREDYSDPPSLSFASTTVNNTSSDSPQAVSVQNYGNTGLTFSGLTVPTDFPQSTGNVTDCSSSSTLAAASNCALRINFLPLSTGTLNESYGLTDNSLNATAAKQSISVSGMATSGISISLSPTTLPNTTVGLAYNQSVFATGGASPYTYSIVSGAVPTGLVLGPGGAFIGAPTSVGNFTFTVQAQDSTPAGSGGPYTGSQAYSVQVSQGTATVNLSNLNQTYTGSPLSVTDTTLPSGLTTTCTYNGSSTIPTAAGSYNVVCTINDPNYTGSNTGTLVISKATATVNLSNLSQAYTGSPLSVTDTTAPTGLTTACTYNGSSTVPIAAGSYTVICTINDSNYTGSNTGTLVISKATATVTLSNLAQTYTGSSLPVTSTTAPTGLSNSCTYNGSSTVPTAAGSYTVICTINDLNYTGSNTGTLVIAKAQPSVTWTTPAAISYGTALSAAQLNASVVGIPGTFSYTPAAGTVLSAGASQSLSVLFTPTDMTDYSTATQSVLITVGKVAPGVGLSSSSNPALSQSTVTFTATVSSTAGTPTGTVTFMNGTTPLGSGILSGGVAMFSTATLPTGTQSISAIYSGDSNFTSAASTTASEVILDFSLTSSSGSSNGGSQTLAPGGTVTDPVTITPTAGATFPTITYLTVTGLPTGATVTLNTPGWTQLTSTSWSLPALASLSDVSLSFHMSAVPVSAKAIVPGGPDLPRMPAALATLLLLPFAPRMRRAGRRLRGLAAVLVLAAIFATVAGTIGCGTANGFFAEKPQNYTVTITATTGTLSHSTNVTLETE